MSRQILSAIVAAAAMAVLPAGPALAQTTLPATTPSTAPSSQPATRPSPFSLDKPTMLKLTVDAGDVNEANTQLARQLGMRAMLVQHTAGLRYAGEEMPYAHAVADFLQHSGFTATDGGMNNLVLTPGKPLGVARLGDAAAMVITRVTCNATRSMTYAQQTTYSYTVAGLLILDPALRVMGVSQNATIDAVELTPPGLRGIGQQNINSYALTQALNESSQTPRISFNFTTSAAVKKIDRIAGRCKAWRVLAEASADVSFEQIAEGQPVTGDGVTVLVSVDARAGRSGALNVALTGPAVDQYKDSRWQQGLQRTVKAMDIDGNVMPTSVYAQPRPGTKGPVQLMLRANPMMGRGQMQPSEFFDQLTTLRIRVPTKIKSVDLPFEIRDLTLVE